jgi:hypothetical protein
MRRLGWERWGALGGFAFVVLYVVAFAALGLEVGNSDRDILDYYASSSHRAKEIVAFFMIAAAALSLIVFGNALRTVISRVEGERSAPVAALAWAGTIACATLILAGNALSRATAFSAFDKEFDIEPNTRRVFESAGYLLFVSATLAAILLVVAVTIAVFRLHVFGRWLGWLSLATALLLPSAIIFIGYLVFVVWVIAVSVVLVRRPSEPQPLGAAAD